METLTTKLETLKQKAEQAKTDKARGEATLESLEKQHTELVAEIKGYGIEPEQLDAEIERLEAEIKTNLEEAEKLLPQAENVVPAPEPSPVLGGLEL